MLLYLPGPMLEPALQRTRLLLARRSRRSWPRRRSALLSKAPVVEETTEERHTHNGGDGRGYDDKRLADYVPLN